MKSAVCVIDVQQGLFAPDPRPFEADAVLTRINLVTDWARKQDFPVLFIQHEQPGTELAYGDLGWQLVSDLKRVDGDHLIRKTTPDSFLHTGLDDLLQQLGITHLYMCGYASEFCVDTTTRRAAGLGYPVTLVADGHTTHDKAHASGLQIRLHHNTTLSDIGSFGVKIEALPAAKIISRG